jgi:hypothetical protein
MDSAHGHFVTRMAAGPSTGQIIGPEHSGVHKQLGSAFWRWPSSSMYAVTWIEPTAAIEGTPWSSSWAQISGLLISYKILYQTSVRG